MRSGLITHGSPSSQLTWFSFRNQTRRVCPSNAPLPGNQVGVLHVTIAPTATVGTTIALTLDPTLTQLANQAGTTSETVANNNLTLVNGAIVVTTPVPALSGWALALLAMALAAVGVALSKR